MNFEVLQCLILFHCQFPLRLYTLGDFCPSCFLCL
nr:MAG TPA: Ribosome biogenesis protein Nop10, Zinc-Ribbon, RNA BINDING PROTEIN [Caudoviricetes sp.]